MATCIWSHIENNVVTARRCLPQPSGTIFSRCIPPDKPQKVWFLVPARCGEKMLCSEQSLYVYSLTENEGVSVLQAIKTGQEYYTALHSSDSPSLLPSYTPLILQTCNKFSLLTWC